MADVAGLKTGAEDCAPLPGTAANSDATMNAKPAIRFPNKIDIRTSSRSSTAGIPRGQGNKRDGPPQQATYRRLVLAEECGAGDADEASFQQFAASLVRFAR
jgi:hypothetical protein